MSTLFTFSEEHFLSLCKQKIPLDCIFLLERIVNQQNIDSEDYLPFIQRLQRKGYIDTKLQLSEYGKALYNSMLAVAPTAPPKRARVEKTDIFEQWWNIYPSTNDFEIKGKHFSGSQKKNIKKEECRKIFSALSNSIPPEDIIAGTLYHINTAKELSLKRKENQLTYIPNSERYLREKYFEPYIEKSKKTPTVGENRAVIDL